MSHSKVFHRILGAMIASAFLVLSFAGSAHAESSAPKHEDARGGKITVIASKNAGVVSTPVPGVSFELHRVSGFDVFDEGDWSEIKKRESNKDFSGLKTEKIADIGPSDDEGRTRPVTTAPGFYMLSATGEHASDYTPSYFTLPSQDAEGSWSYDLIAHPKPSDDSLKPGETPSGSVDPEHSPLPTESEGVPAPVDADSTPSPVDGKDSKTGGFGVSPVALILGIVFILFGAGAIVRAQKKSN